MKLHLLTHLVDDIRNHGPAIRYSTEVFECYNSVFRMCSVLSNHQAPSRDICEKMKDMERFRHITTGGYWIDSNGTPTCASVQVRHFFQSNLILQSHLGWVKPTPTSTGHIKTVPRNVRKALSWVQSSAAQLDPIELADLEQDWFEGEHVTASSGDRCKLKSWIVVKTPTQPVIGEIVQLLTTSSLQQGRVVLDVFTVSANRHSYLDMPVLVQPNVGRQSLQVFNTKDILFLLNVQHDCRTLSCAEGAVEFIRQEKNNTTIRRQAIEHNNTRIYVVNMHALHNAHLIRRVFPRALVRPIPLCEGKEREDFLEERANTYHQREEAKRVANKKKRQEAKEAKAAKEAKEAADVGKDVKMNPAS
ncbi:hypothetical protein FRC12_023457 [Ceratobasidium sp. 428]|nr:hypothetical protein FRC12_023457 [Ceratobasidium sp. 428]